MESRWFRNRNRETAATAGDVAEESVAQRYCDGGDESDGSDVGPEFLPALTFITCITFITYIT